MSQSVVWPPIGGTSYSVPEASEEDWATLTNYLVALSGAQGTTAQKWAARTAITSPATISSPSDCLVGVNLTTPGPSIVNLPVGVVGQVFVIADMKGDAATNNITVTPSLGQTIAAASSYPININKGAVGLVFTGAGNWSVIFQSTTGAGGAVSRSLITAGTPGYSVFNNDTTGLLSEEQFVNAVRGGLGVNASAFTGYLKATAGVFSASAIAAADLPTGIDAAKIGAGAVSNTELSYLDGVTGPIQAAIDAKATGNAPITPGTATKLTYDAKGLVTAGTSITAADLPTGIDAAKIGTGVVSNAEFAFLDGVTGAIQTALDTKVAGQASSVDNEVALFSSTTGKVIKRASGTGIAVLTSGVLATATFDNITPAQASQAGKFLGTNGTTTSWQTVAAGLIGTPKTANYTAVNSDMVQADTTAGSFTVTLPSGTLAASVGILDAGPFFTTNNLIVAPATGQSIDIGAVNDTITFDQNRQSCLFYRAAGSTVWEIQTASNTAVPEASAGVSGYVNNGTQSFSGNKTFLGSVTVPDANFSHTKLANITAGSILMGNASAIPTATALTGDVTISSTGVTAIGSGVIVNADVNASAAIAYSKLSLGSSIVNADISGSAAIAGSKLVLAASSTQGVVAPRTGQIDISAQVQPSTAGPHTSARCQAIYYQDQAGNHRMKFNICFSSPGAAGTIFTIGILGTVFKNATAYNQAVTGFGYATAAYARCYTTPNTNVINLDYGSGGATIAGMSFSGDVELNAKPSWA